MKPNHCMAIRDRLATGGAMRIAPLGAYFADDLNKVIEQATYSVEVSHTHPEAIAGGIAVAIATALAWQTRVSQIRLTKNEFLGRILQLLPESQVRDVIHRAILLDADASLSTVVSTLGNGSQTSTQDTVPFALWCVAKYMDNYEDALWYTVSGGGDVDTNCAIVGGIVAANTDIPASWLQSREPLPDWAINIP